MIALGTLAMAALLQGAVAGWAVDVAADKVQRGRVASDVLGGFLELSATKQRLRTWLSQALLDPAADAAQRDDLQADMVATLQRLRELAAEAARADGVAPGSQGLDSGVPDSDDPARAEHAERAAALDVLQQSVEELRDTVARVRPLPAGADAVAAWAKVSRVFDVSQGRDLRSLLSRSIERERAAVRRERLAADHSLALVRSLALGATLALALAAASLALYFARALRRPLDELSDGARALQQGDLTHRIPDHRRDEFARLATGVNAMAEELQQHRQREAEARQRLEDLVQVRTAELQEAVQTLRELDARRRQLFADISHELRTPTTAIRGEAEIVLRGGTRPVDDYRAALQRIVGTSQQLGAVIDDLLTMARSDIDALALRREPLDVAQPLREAVEQAQTLGRGKGVAVAFEGSEPATARVLGDGQRLRQLFTLLLDNAVRYSHAHGRVQVRAGRSETPGEAPHWWLRIVDQGIGIGEDELPRVFERSFRSERARRHRADGSGLGLPIAQALARAHGGRIALRSEVGQGTEVSLTLPLLPAADAKGTA